MIQHIVKKCEVKSDLEVLHCITSDMAGARFTPPPQTHMLSGRSVAPRIRTECAQKTAAPLCRSAAAGMSNAMAFKSDH
jgi:hypothetical protein